jgi:putative nucleotidyltransferase with HDIG domain
VTKRAKSFTVELSQDGSLDPVSLAQMGERWVLTWLRERLSGNDPHLPLDRRSGEDPDALVVGLLRSAGPLDPASRLVGRAAARLLEAAGAEATAPAFLGPLLRLCQQVRLPDTEPWFGTFVEQLAHDHNAVEVRWGGKWIDEILYGAIMQAPGVSSSAVRPAWLELLSSPRYTTQALMTLGSWFEAELEHLATWWQACPEAERGRELWQTISRAVKLEGGDRVRELLSAQWADLPQDLLDAINDALARLEIASIQSPSNGRGEHAIVHAGGGKDISVSLRRLAEAMSAIARTGDLGRIESTFRSSGSSNRDVRLIEETFRALLVSLEESQRARERSYVEAVGAVVTAADARDLETTGHSFRVALYALALARALGLPAEQLKAIEWGALLHDVGKMAVPDAVLRKPGPLTANEWHIMKQHPMWGFDMLAEVSFLQPAAIEIVYSHHERWDGQGYPRGLGGEQIPLAARVFAVVDTYDAITSDRPYRRARSHAAAVAEMRRVSGQQLDPAMVEVFVGLSELELRQIADRYRNVRSPSLPDDLLNSLTDPGAEALRG